MKPIEMSIQGQFQLNNLRNQCIYPWGLNDGIKGETWVAHTDLGNPVDVWVPDEGNSEETSYFCHGWALGTYELFGYTVYSGGPMARVLQDEWNLVQDPAPGDICVWFGPGGGYVSAPVHSARVESVPVQM